MADKSFGAGRDPWGLGAETAAAPDRREVLGRARRGHAKTTRSAARGRNQTATPAGGRRSPRRARIVGALAAVIGVAIASGGPALATGAPRGSTTAKPVALTSGTSPLHDDYAVFASSSGGALVHTLPRTGNGGLGQALSTVSALPAVGSKLVALKPKLAGKGDVLEGAPTIAGSMVVWPESGPGGSALWWRDLASGKSGVAALPATDYLESAAPGGWLFDGGTSLYEQTVKPKRTTKLATFAEGISGLVAGPDGVGVMTTSGSNAVLDYVTYAAPHRVQRLGVLTSGDYWSCTSATTDAVGCSTYLPTTGTSTVTRFRTTGKSSTYAVAGQTYDPPVMVTPKVTSWAVCSDPIKSCALNRAPAAGGKAKVTELPAFTLGMLGGVGDTYVFGEQLNAATSGGLFRMADTSSKPVHVVTAPTARVAAEAVTLSVSSSGKGYVTWIDDGQKGLGVWQRSISASSGLAQSLELSLGSAKLLAQSGFVASDATSYGLNLSGDSGAGSSSVVYNHYNKQPTKNPLSVLLRAGTKTKTVAGAAAAEVASAPGFTFPVQVSGSYVLYRPKPTRWTLYDAANGKRVSLPTKNVVSYAIGDGELVYVEANGSVWRGVIGGTAAEIVAPAGQTVYEVIGLGVAGPYTAWAVETTFGEEVAYADTAKPSTSTTVSVTSGVTGISLSSGFLGLDESTGSGPALYVLALPGTTPKLLDEGGIDLSVSGDVAAWLNATSDLPYVTKV